MAIYLIISFVLGTLSMYILTRFFPNNLISASVIYRPGTGQITKEFFGAKIGNESALRSAFKNYNGGGSSIMKTQLTAKFARVINVRKYENNEPNMTTDTFEYTIEYWEK